MTLLQNSILTRVPSPSIPHSALLRGSGHRFRLFKLLKVEEKLFIVICHDSSIPFFQIFVHVYFLLAVACLVFSDIKYRQNIARH